MTPAFPAGVFLSCASVSRQLPCRRLHISLSGAEKHSFQHQTLLRHNPGAENAPLAHQTAPPRNFRCRKTLSLPSGMDLSGRKIIFVLSET